jgi:hypothetical protein
MTIKVLLVEEILGIDGILITGVPLDGDALLVEILRTEEMLRADEIRVMNVLLGDDALLVAETPNCEWDNEADVELFASLARAVVLVAELAELLSNSHSPTSS